MGLQHPAQTNIAGRMMRRGHNPASHHHRFVCSSTHLTRDVPLTRALPRVQTKKPSRRHASGFTLTEILVVLGVLAALASMTIPSVMKLHNRRKLTEAAERARAVAASARVHAIETGLVYQFCCEANGSHFAVVPFEPDHLTSGGNGQGGSGQSPTAPLLHRLAGHLPKGVVFSSVAPFYVGMPTGSAAALPGMQSGIMVQPTAHKIQPSVFDGLPNAGELAGVNWANPILFNADGSANADVQVVVSDTHSQQIVLHVRAFTGAVSMERISVRSRK